MKEFRVLTPTGMLGYGFPAKWFRQGMALAPHLIVTDAGSTDSGPQKLALGSMTCSLEAYERDLGYLLEAVEKNIPVIVSSAGGDGTAPHVDVFVDIVRRLAKPKGLRFKLATILAEVDKALIAGEMARGRIKPLGPVPPLTEQELAAATTVVAQMGAEPFQAVFQQQPDVGMVIAGRAYDPAPLAAGAIAAGFDPGLAWHMGKIMECGGKCADPSGKVIMGYLREDHFDLEPVDPEERCTVQSVVAHTLYEQSHPYLLAGPGGLLDISECSYEQVSERRVRVSGSRFTPSDVYTIKLEGARPLGYRSIFIAGARDPLYIAAIEEVKASILERVRTNFPDVDPSLYEIIFHVYGKNGVMGPLEPCKDVVPHEICLIGEVVAPSQALADALCNQARVAALHTHYSGRIATAGNVALPFTPLEIPLGQVCKFNVYHLMEVSSPTALFPIQFSEV